MRGARFSRYSHIPAFSVASLYGNSVSWPMCVSAGLQPTPAEKIVILGGHIGLLGEGITLDQCEWMTPRVYPCGIVRHILRAAQNHIESNFPSASLRGREGGPAPAVTTHAFFPTMTHQVFGQDRLAAVLSGRPLGHVPDTSLRGTIGGNSCQGVSCPHGFGELTRIGMTISETASFLSRKS